MSIIDFSHLTPQQRLALIGELWGSLDAESVPLTPGQVAEIERRLDTVDEDIKHGIDADELEAELDRRYA
jgi:putative addiction module component (TIGR02574 family)